MPGEYALNVLCIVCRSFNNPNKAAAEGNVLLRYWTRRDADHFEVSFAFKRDVKTVTESGTK